MQLFNQGGRQHEKLTTVDSAGSVTYQFYHEVNDKTSHIEPVYYAFLNYRDLKNGDEPMFNFAAQTSIGKAMQLYPEAALKSLVAEIDGMLERKVWKGVLFDSLKKKQCYTRPP